MIYLQINEILKERKHTKYWFIKNMGGGYQSLSNLMNNATSSIHFETLNKICEILECEPGDVIIFKKGTRRKNINEQNIKAV